MLEIIVTHIQTDIRCYIANNLEVSASIALAREGSARCLVPRRLNVRQWYKWSCLSWAPRFELLDHRTRIWKWEMRNGSMTFLETRASGASQGRGSPCPTNLDCQKSLDKSALIGIDVTECVQNMTIVPAVPVTGPNTRRVCCRCPWSCPGCLGIIDQGTGISGHAAVLQYSRRHTLYCNTGDCTLTLETVYSWSCTLVLTLQILNCKDSD